MFQEIITRLQASTLVYSYEVLENFNEEAAKLIKIKANLKDGSILYVRELVKADCSFYSYHWQDAEGNLLLRWDNAPHHPAIPTFPHHLHQGNKIIAAYRITIKEVLDEIERRFQ